MAENRPRWQVCKFCNEIRERPCIYEAESRPCEFGKRDRVRKAEASARYMERMLRNGDL